MELSQLDEKFSDEEFAPVDLAGVAAEVAEDLRSNAESTELQSLLIQKLPS